MPLIFSSLDRIETISSAMELRAFGSNKKRTWYNGRPFKKGDYGYVLSSLLDTLDAIEYYRNKLNEPSRLAAWIQILDAYTNQNPVYAFVVYII